MEQFLPLIKDTLVSAVLAEATRRAQKRSKTGLALYALAGVVLAIAISFLSFAGYSWLLTKYSVPAAAAISAAFLFGSGIVAFLAGHYCLTRNRAADTQRAQAEMQQLISVVSEQLPHDLVTPVKENPKTSLALATVAGLLVGSKIH